MLDQHSRGMQNQMIAVQLRHVQKTSGSTVLIPHIDLEVAAGQCVVIQCNHELGHQLIMAIMGQTSISEGSIVIRGETLTPDNAPDIRIGMGIQLLSDAAYERLKVREYLQFYAHLYKAELDMDLILQRLGLAEKRHSRVSQLTSSEMRRLSIARALVHNPLVLLMEDPEQNVDLETSYIIRNLVPALMEEGKAVIITTMVLEQAITLTNDVYLYSHAGFKKLEAAEEEQGPQEAEQQARSAVSEIAAETDSDADTKAKAEMNVVHDESKQSAIGAAPAELVLEPESTDNQPPAFVQPVRFEKIPAKVGDKLILFDPTEIDYIESHEGVANLHVSQGIYACSMSLSDLEARLKGFGFYRCHRSYLVNLQKVREVITWTRNSYSLILDDHAKSSIPLSKSKYDELKKIIGI